MIEIPLSNNKTMTFSQPSQYDEIYCEIGKDTDVDEQIIIPTEDMLALINYYRKNKTNGLEL